MTEIKSPQARIRELRLLADKQENFLERAACYGKAAGIEETTAWLKAQLEEMEDLRKKAYEDGLDPREYLGFCFACATLRRRIEG